MKDHKRSKCVFDPNYEDITDSHIPVKRREIYWAKIMNELYSDAEEDLTLNAPNPKGRAVQISFIFETNHGGDQITRIPRKESLDS